MQESLPMPREHFVAWLTQLRAEHNNDFDAIIDAASEQLGVPLLISEPRTFGELIVLIEEELQSHWQSLGAVASLSDSERCASVHNALQVALRRRLSLETPLATAIPPSSAFEIQPLLPEPFAASWPIIEYRSKSLGTNFVFWIALALWLVATVSVWRMADVEIGGRILLWLIASVFLWFCTTIGTKEAAWPRKLTTVSALCEYLSSDIQQRYERLQRPLSP
jgi:hypothetical protein